MIWRIVLTVLAGYFLGSFNGAILISTHMFGDDVRNHGSGNAGMTNFMRTYGKARLVPVILIDMGKTFLACMLGWLLMNGLGLGAEGKMIAGIATMIGHAFPVFYGFRGGKGVLSAAAVALSMSWWAAAIALVVFFVILETTHYMSLASMTAVCLWAIECIVLFWGRWFVVGAVALVAVMVVFLHRSNIRRLRQGNERKTYLHQPKQ